MPTFALNFSRPGSEVVAQYWIFLALEPRRPRKGASRASSASARRIAAGVADMGPYQLITDGTELPVFAFHAQARGGGRNYSVFDVSDRLRDHGWLVPAYTFPENRQDLSVLRVVVRAGMSADMADLFLDDLRKQTESLEALTTPLPDRVGQAQQLQPLARRWPPIARGVGARAHSFTPFATDGGSAGSRSTSSCAAGSCVTTFSSRRRWCS